MTTHIELLAPLEERTGQGDPYWWPLIGKQTQLRTELDWALTCYGNVPTVTADLLHIAAAAYLADLRTGRPLTFGREIVLTVHVHHPAVWAGEAGQTLLDLLAWLSGDQWTLLPVPIGKHAEEPADAPMTPPGAGIKDTMLLSGGLDSFCGAVDNLATASERLHIGHRDTATSVQHAQLEVRKWISAQSPNFAWIRSMLRPDDRKRENTTRTRSLLFMTMAIAAAAGNGAKQVIVPENGYTSLNIPLVASRSGALSTKSTHPWTFLKINETLAHAGIEISVSNPYLGMTKGQLLKKAYQSAPTGFLEATANTLSCAKLDSGRYKKNDGGNPNLNCGLCYACLVRRGSYTGAGLTDPTIYLVNEMKKPARAVLKQRRHDDMWALDLAEKKDLTEDDLIASACWPPGYDLGEALDLVNRGRRELFSVPR